MNEELFVITDISGSMAESGKNHITRNLCNYITQLRKLDSGRFMNVVFLFHKWNTIIEKIHVDEEKGFPLLSPEKNSDLEILSVFLEENDVGTLPMRVLILSDGNFSQSDLKKFEDKWSDSEKVLIRTVAVGADSDLKKLRRISMGNETYLSENIAASIRSALHDSGMKVNRPFTLDDLGASEHNEVEEDWE